jgi:hypothetical protein
MDVRGGDTSVGGNAIISRCLVLDPVKQTSSHPTEARKSAYRSCCNETDEPE